MEIVFSERCLEYSYFGHVESPDGVRKAGELLTKFGYRFLEPEPASEEDLLRVHTRDWVERAKRGCFFDVNTPGSENIYEYASLSAGGAIKAARVKGFSLLRPPGHRSIH